MGSLTNAISMIRSVRGDPRDTPPPIELTQTQVSDILDTTFNNHEFLAWHLKRQHWIRANVHCSPIWVSRLKTLTANVGDRLLTATAKGDHLACWTDGCATFPISHYATPRCLINSALDFVLRALKEFRVISANLASFNEQDRCVRWLFFHYLKQVLEYSIVLMRCCRPAPADDEDTWFSYQWEILDHLETLFEFDLEEFYIRTIEKQGDRSLNGVIPPPGKMLAQYFAAEPPTFVKQEGEYGKKLVKIEEVPEELGISLITLNIEY
jgi:hypothetical protein